MTFSHIFYTYYLAEERAEFHESIIMKCLENVAPPTDFLYIQNPEAYREFVIQFRYISLSFKIQLTKTAF